MCELIDCENTTNPYNNKYKNKKTVLLLERRTNSKGTTKTNVLQNERWKLVLNISSGENRILGLFHQRINSSACGGVMDEVIKIMEGTLKLRLSVLHPF